MEAPHKFLPVILEAKQSKGYPEFEQTKLRA